MKMKYLLLIACLFLPIQFACVAEPATTPEQNGFSGKVVEATNTAGYTYVLVDTGSNRVWAAGTQVTVSVGDQVAVGPGLSMTQYHSKSLNRDFDLVYFTGSITVAGRNAGAAPTLPPGHPSLTGLASGPNQDVTGVKRADGGKTIQEIYTAKSELAGKPVTVRGKVVKYNAMILGKNWLHIRDGSGSAEAKDNDLAVTTDTPAKLGDTVLVTGNVSTNRDFGAGYRYTVIIEDAKVTVE